MAVHPVRMAALSFTRIWPWLAAALSGLLLALCFPPYNVGGLAFVALIPVLAAIWLKRPARRAAWYWFRLGYVTGLVFFTTTFVWLSNLATLFHSAFLNFLSFYLALYLSLFFGVWAWFTGWITGRHFDPIPPLNPTQPFVRPPLLLSSRNLILCFVIAAAWTALEWARSLGALSFGWNPLAVALHKDLALIQIAEITGVHGLSFMLVMCNTIGLITILRLRAEVGRTRLRPHFDFSLTVALVALVWIYGVRTLVRRIPAEGPVLKVAMLQPNVPQAWKLAGDRDLEIFERLAELHGYAETQKPHLVLWPEASVPGGMLADEEVEKFVRHLASKVPALMLGTDDFVRDRNSAALLLPNATQVIFYDKQHLVPFGEYLPFRPLLGWAFGNLVPGDFSPGIEPGLFELPSPPLKLAPLICFEDTVGSLVRRPVQRGAHILVNLTNDGWFGLTAGAEQHFVNSIFRTVENRRPMLRCTNTGISAFVDIYGKVDRWAPPFEQRMIAQEITIPSNLPTTFYSVQGDVFPLGSFIVAVLGVVTRVALQRRKNLPQ